MAIIDLARRWLVYVVTIECHLGRRLRRGRPYRDDSMPRSSSTLSFSSLSAMLRVSAAAALVLSPLNASADSVSVCAAEIPNGMTADGAGPQPLLKLYERVIELVKLKSDLEFEMSFAPALRCQSLFNRGDIDVVWPFIIIDDEKKFRDWNYVEPPVHAMPIIMGGYYVFSRIEDEKISDVRDLVGRTVAHARGYGIPDAIMENDAITRSELSDNALIPNVIRSKRADAGVIQTGWVGILEQQGLLDGLHHGEVIDFWGGSFIFHADEKGILLANKFSNSILRLVVDGQYDEIMKDAPYAIPAYSTPATFFER